MLAANYHKKDSSNKRPAQRFDKSLVPAALPWYEQELGKLGRPNRAGWLSARCPFHQSQSGKSFAVHRDGAFHCFGCDARGSDIVQFVMLRDRCTFIEAAKRLGCWNSGQVSETERRAQDVQRRLQEAERKESQYLDAAVRRERARRRDEIINIERLQAARRKLESLNPSDPAATQHIDLCIAPLADLLPRWREAVAVFHLLAFGTHGEQSDFVRHRDQCTGLIRSVLDRGFVRDDRGVVTEVPL